MTDEAPPRERRGRLPGRRGSPEVSVFGRRAVLEALASPDVEIACVRVDRRAPGELRAALHDACRERGVPFERVDRRGVAALSGEPHHDQGVAARLRLLRVSAPERFLAERTGAGARAPARVLALDGVTNPANIGMIVRSLVAAGLDALLWPLSGSPWVSGLVVKSAAAALYACPILPCPALPGALADFQGAGFEVLGLRAGASQALFGHVPPHRAVYVVGSETTGISPEVADLLDGELAIPLAAPVESLNVAVAASLLCFQVGGAMR